MSQVTGVLALNLIRIVTMSSAEISKIRVVIYSDDSAVRAAVISALGRKIAADLPAHEVFEFAIELFRNEHASIREQFFRN